VVVCDGTGAELIAELSMTAWDTYGRVAESRPGRPEPRCVVRLCQSALRGEQFTWLLQKGTELGVSTFVPVIFGRTQPADYTARLERYAAIVREAAEQCERSRLPAIEPVQSLDRVLNRAGDMLMLGETPDRSLVQRFLLDEREEAQSLREAATPGARRVDLLVGPEGGLTLDERAKAHAAGFLPVSLGARILRSETAGLVASALVLAANGDLG